MAKKNKNRGATAQPSQPAQVVPKETTQDVQPSVVDSHARGLSKGNTMEMVNMFDDIFSDHDKAVLEAFPKRKQIVGILKSIYANEIRLRARKTVWGLPVLAFEIAVTALDDASVFVRLDVELPDNYPKIPPVIRLDELEPDDATLRKNLRDVIAHFEKTELGDDSMVSSMLQGIQDKLGDAHAEIQKRAQGTSLEQERATVESAAQVNATIRQQLMSRQKEAETAASEAKLAQEFDAQRRRRQLLSSNESAPDQSTTAGEDYPADCIVFDHDITISNASYESALTFRAVQPMGTLYHRNGKLVTIACPFRSGEIIKMQLVLKEVRLASAEDSEAQYRQTMSQIESALQEVKTFEHSSIVKIHDYKLVQILNDNAMAYWELYILTEHAQQSLDGLLDMVDGLGAVKVRTYARSILDALEFYDRKGYVHPAIHAYNILLFGSQHKTYQAKLSDGYGTTLRELVERAQASQPPELNQGNWAAPELIGGRSARSNKTCIWELGVVLLQMVLGNDMTKKYTSPEDALSQAGLDQDFDYMISKMCSISARKRPSAFQAQSFQFFKNHDLSVFQSENESRRMTKAALVPKSGRVSESRWISEWEPVEKLGKGGFGTVVKARHRLDGHFYAIKQLKCKSIRDLEDIWGEVRMLAQLNHPGIVRYFVAWSEEDPQITADSETSTVLTDPRSFAPPTGSVALRNSLFAVPSTGHDFMDPSLAQLSDVEDDEDEAEDDTQSTESSDDGNMFGYQSAPSASDADSQALESEAEVDPESDPFGLQAVANNLDEAPNLFESDSADKSRERTNIPSRPQPFIAAKGTPSVLRRPPQYYNKSLTLFIQMELCDTGTLLELIRNGLPDQVNEAWRIFRLVVDGLEYIHEQGVVHRDLKPTNIFIDSHNMPKIGDFGLAAASQATVDGSKLATHIAGPLSKGVGTLFYIAPELGDSKSTGQYSTKADMFALGVIFFEMCFPFRTATERVSWMRSINKDGSQLPSRFENPEYKTQGRIIVSLLDHNPDRRPSARALLLDPEIPEPLEEDKEQRYFQRLVQGDPQQLQLVMQNFMGRTASRPQMLSYAHVDKEDFRIPDEYLLSVLQQKLREVFKAHGGVESNRETIFPVEGLYPNTAKFLDAAGFTVQLPYDLTVPFARAIAVRKPQYTKSFTFGIVFRQRKELGLEPLCIPEVDFDLVSYSAQDLSLRDAQVISVLDDCLLKLSSLFSRSFSIIISHGDLLDLILDACGVPEQRIEVVKRLLSNLNIGKTTWKQLQQELQSPEAGLTNTMVSDLSGFNISSGLEEVRDRVLRSLNKLKKADLATKATRTLTRLQEVNDYINSFRVRTPVLFSPLSNTSEMLYRGSLMFKCTESKSSKAIAVGGRYDALIRSYQTPTHKTFARAAGFRINIMDLVAHARSDAQSTIGKSARTRGVIPATIEPRIDIVVTSFDEATLYGTCVEILRNLLDAGMSAELSDPFSNMDELDQAYSNVSRFWVVIVRPGGTKIKVRSPNKDENEVVSSDLTKWLRDEMEERQPASISEPVLRRTRSSHGAGERENVTILTPQHKSKKVNRAMIVDSARSAAQDLAESISKNCRVLAIDTDDDTLQRLRNTRLADSETWRTLRHSVALTDREYIQEIQEQLQDWNKAGQDGAFVCNYKTKTCIFYDFGKA